RRSDRTVEKSALTRIAISRSILTLLLIFMQFSTFSIILTAIILVQMGFIYALFLVYTLALSMELLPEGKAGLFNAMVGVGGAAGSFIGPFLAENLGFAFTFLTSGVIFFFTYIMFKIFS
ncbi:MAG: hypothetical protein ACP5QI_08055, partial [Candidatus Bathyarchaeia archaeon]